MEVFKIVSICAIATALIYAEICFLKLKIELEKLKIENERYKHNLVYECMKLIDKFSKMERGK